MFGMNYGKKGGAGKAAAGPGMGYSAGKGKGGAAAWGGAEEWDDGSAAWGAAPAKGAWGPPAGKGAAGAAKGPAKGAASGPGMNYQKGGAWGAPAYPQMAAAAAKGVAKGAKGGRSKTGEMAMNGETNWKPAGNGMLYQAISEAVSAMGHLETEWDAEKLDKKLRDYFNKAGKNMEWFGTLKQLIGKYADNAIGSIYAGLGDREWLYSGEVDFLLILDAGIKDYFPGYMLKSVAQTEFEQLVLTNYERAFDECRFSPILSEKVPEIVSGPKIKKKVWNSINEGRKDAWNEGHEDLEAFTRSWINHTAKHLSTASGGSPDGTLPSDQMSALFLSLFEAGALPAALMQNAEAPVGIVEEAVVLAYGDHTEGEWHPDSEPAAKKLKGVFADWGPANYGGKGERVFATREAVAAKKAEAEA